MTRIRSNQASNRVAIAQVAEPRPRGDRRILDGVLRLELAAEQHRGEPVGADEVPVGEPDEGRLSTGRHVAAQNRLLVDRQPLIAHARPDDGAALRGSRIAERVALRGTVGAGRHDGPVTAGPAPTSLPPDPVQYDEIRNEHARKRGLPGPYIAGGDDPELEKTLRYERRYVRLLIAMVVAIVVARVPARDRRGAAQHRHHRSPAI